MSARFSLRNIDMANRDGLSSGIVGRLEVQYSVVNKAAGEEELGKTIDQTPKGRTRK